MYLRSTLHLEQSQMVVWNQGLTDDRGDTELLSLQELMGVEGEMLEMRENCIVSWTNSS